MRSILKLLAVLGFAGALFSVAPAAAQGGFSRTWVASTGTDSGGCTRVAPCRSLIFAMTRTLPGGQISCVDSASFGPIIIFKSLTIECQNSPGGIIVDNGNAITIAAQPGDVVQLRGIQIAGLPPTSCCGIRFESGGTLVLQNIAIRNFYGDYGIVFEPSDASRLIVEDSSITNSGNATTGGGILIQPIGTGSASVLLNRVSIIGNNGPGVRLDGAGNTGPGNFVQIRDSQISGNLIGLLTAAPDSTTTQFISIENSAIVRNSTSGIFAKGWSTVRVSGSTISGNATGIGIVGTHASVGSFGDNMLFGNTTNGAFNGTVPKQ